MASRANARGAARPPRRGGEEGGLAGPAGRLSGGAGVLARAARRRRRRGARQGGPPWRLARRLRATRASPTFEGRRRRAATVAHRFVSSHRAPAPRPPPPPPGHPAPARPPGARCRRVLPAGGLGEQEVGRAIARTADSPWRRPAPPDAAPRAVRQPPAGRPRRGGRRPATAWSCGRPSATRSWRPGSRSWRPGSRSWRPGSRCWRPPLGLMKHWDHRGGGSRSLGRSRCPRDAGPKLRVGRIELPMREPGAQ